MHWQRFRAVAVALTLCAISGSLAAQANPETAVRRAVEDYFAGVTDNNAEALDRAFHPDAYISSYLPSGRLYRRPYREWRGFVNRPRAEDADQRRNRIVSVDITGTAAMVKVDMVWPTVHYVDYLSLIEVDGAWRIINKIWWQEARGSTGNE